MRLVHSTTLELREFADNKIPAYAILSHTWGKDEVSFQDMQTGAAYTKEGYAKVTLCAQELSSMVCIGFGSIRVACRNVTCTDNSLQKRLYLLP